MSDTAPIAAVAVMAPAGQSPEGTIRVPRKRGPVARVLQYVAYPLLLLAAVVMTAMAIQLRLPLLLVNSCFLIGSFSYLALLERIIPYDPAWHPAGWEWRRDALYYVITLGTGAIARAAVASVALVVAPLHSNLPLAVEIPVAITVLSLCSFLYHWLSHHVPWLWRVHGIHHVPMKVNVSNNNVNHFIDVFGHLCATHLPLLLLGLSQQAVFVATMLKASQGYGIHANIDVKLGWLNYFLITPEQHRLHHSSAPREGGHYSADLTLWDLLIGSFTWRPNKVPVEVGVQDPVSFPPASAILENQVHPFRPRSRHSGHSTEG
jgi:sterol desaturase/sphingolipid hydroxylase (fatty acid hydroxylase superfamily)